MIFFLIDSVMSVGTVNTVSVAVIKGSKTSINSADFINVAPLIV